MKTLAVAFALTFTLSSAAQAAFEVCNRHYDKIQFVVAMLDGAEQVSAGWYTLERDECDSYFTNASASARFFYRVSGPVAPDTPGARPFCISQAAFTSREAPNCAASELFAAEYLPAQVSARPSDGKKGSGASTANAAFVIPPVREDVPLRASMMRYRASYASPEFWRASGDWELYKLVRPSGEGTCFAIKEFPDGTLLRFGKEPSAPDLWHFQIGNAEWTSLEHGTSYELKAKLTKRYSWTLTTSGMAARVGWPVFLGHRFGADSALLGEIKSGSSFSIEYKGKRIANPSLRGSTNAVNMVTTCMREFGGASGSGSSGGGGGSSNDPFAD